VLDPRDETSYVHRAAGETYGGFTIVAGNFTSLQQTVQMFPSGITLIGDAFIPKDFSVNELYIQDLHSQRPEMGLEYAKSRAKSHMRQWEAFERCGQLLSGPVSHANYTLRMRDDSAVMERFEPRMLQRELLDDGFYTPDCAGYGGINDKVALIKGRGAAQTYFSLLLDTMRNRFQEVHQRLMSENPRHCNPENALKVMLELGLMKITRLQPVALPIMPSKNLRRDGLTNLCFFNGDEHYRQCMPEHFHERFTSFATAGFSIKKYAYSEIPSFLCEDRAFGY
ncbi:unnamed protein product, partial [Symbiodinium pilosum]